MHLKRQATKQSKAKQWSSKWNEWNERHKMVMASGAKYYTQNMLSAWTSSRKHTDTHKYWNKLGTYELHVRTYIYGIHILFYFIAAYLLFTSSNNSLVPSTARYAGNNIDMPREYRDFIHTILCTWAAAHTATFFTRTTSIYRNGMEWNLQNRQRKII